MKSIVTISAIISMSCLFAYVPMSETPTQEVTTSAIIIPTPDPTAEPTPTPEPTPQREYLGTYTLYAYCPCVACCGKDNGITASGTIATQGRTVAADLPFGTVIYIDGVGERVVEDRGGGIKGNKIDVFMDSHAAALQFGVRKAEVWRI